MAALAHPRDSELTATPFSRSYELCFGFNRQAITKSRSLG